jgi:UDP-glucose 4-epimerase
MRAVVTGGAGFIGSAVVDRLVAQGSDVLILDDLSGGSETNLKEAYHSGPGTVHLTVADIGEVGTTEAVAAHRPDVVFHLAAQVNVNSSVDDPVADAHTNIIGLLRVLNGAQLAGTRKFVFTSSGAIYGEVDPKLLPLQEDTTRRPLSPYGVAKLAGAFYLEAYEALHGLAGTTLALANVYGPRQDPHGEAGVVAIFAERLLSGQPCTIYGDGEQTRDFVYVGDVAEAFLAAAERGNGQLLNIGTGVETSVNHLYSSMAAAAGGPGEPVREPERLGELKRSALSSARATTELGWCSTTSLEEGLSATLDWFANR